MKIQVELATVKEGVIKISGIDYFDKKTKVLIEINTKDPENYKYFKWRLQKYPWTRSCKTWGEVLKKLKGKDLEIRKEYKVA